MLNKILFKTVTPGLFRLFLAVIVVVFHTVSFLTIGHYAVYVFFILSGYWIFKMYTENYIAYKNPYLVYIRSRLFRLIPIYWFILFFTLMLYAVIPQLNDKAHRLIPNIFSSVFFNMLLLGVSKQSFLFIVPVWSLDVEVQFYLIAPLLLLLFTNRAIALLVTFIFSILSLILIYQSSPILDAVNILIYLPYFLIGGLIYLFKVQFSERVVEYTISFILFILLINYTIPYLRTNYLLNKNANMFHFNYSESLNVIFALLTIPFITCNVRQKVSGRKNESILSSMAFVIYLIHWPLLQVYSLGIRNVAGAKKFIFLISFYLSCIFLSWLISRFIDTFFESKRRSWIKRKQLAITQV